ncbi:TPA: terminase small subunit [Salmonella enterica subsp. enterica serovar Waycross]|nr:terminase small subunit [Salmonella enterica subsp. enterica serovar Waycross]HEC6604786.1 terminase small subunit [Salmonella enterica subsp. enterica serovar Waycross]
MSNLTLKQEAFCQAYIETGNASEAYRKAYNAERMKPEVVNVKAAELLNNGKITVRVDELRGEHRQRHNLTVDDLIEELEEARQAALQAETPQSSAAVGATMGKAKLLGLDKVVVDNISSDGSMATKPTTIRLVGVDPANGKPS